MEEWRFVKGYEDYFLISNYGKVFSIRTERILKTFIHKQGYEVFSTRIGGRKGKVKLFKVHRLVTEAFIKNPENKPQVNHIDGDKQNNCVANLEWVTAKENTQHALKIGLSVPCKGEQHGLSKLKEEDIRFIRNNYIAYDKKLGTNGLAKYFNVHHSIISDVVNRKTWKHIE